MPFPHQFGRVLSDPVDMSQALQANFRQAYTKGEADAAFLSPAEGDAAYLGPHASMYQSSAQAIAENTATYLINQAKGFQTVTGMVDTANNQIVIPRTGLYRCTAGVSFVAPGVNIHMIAAYIYVNGVQTVGAGKPALASAATPISSPVTRLLSLTANDVLKPAAYWYAGVGGTYTTVAGNFYTFIEVEWVGPTPTA